MHNEPIASDDPLAQQKLTERIAHLEALQERMSAANKIVRKFKHDPQGGLLALAVIGFTSVQANKLFEPDYGGRFGFAAYELQNNNANIRRLKARLGTICEHANDVTTEEELHGCKIIDSVEAFRVQIEFNGKPPERVRSFLKSCGFRWAPSVGFWQLHRSPRALRKAREAVLMLAQPASADENTVSEPEHPLSAGFQSCCEEFRGRMYKLANQAGKDVFEIYRLWREYSDRVGGEGGQSALISEFAQWYAKDLTPVVRQMTQTPGSICPNCGHDQDGENPTHCLSCGWPLAQKVIAKADENTVSEPASNDAPKPSWTLVEA